MPHDAACILVVEDDPDINESVAVRLRADGHAVTQAFSGSEAALVLEHDAFDVVVCDLMLPGLAGEDLVALLRDKNNDAAVVVISAKAEAADRIGLLELGADDYLVKPFDLHELSARVAVQLRHRARTASVPPQEGVLVAGAWTVDTQARTLSVDGTEVPLTRIEYNLVELFARHPRRVFTRRELYEHAWGEPFACDDNTVNVHISNVRAKLKPTGTDGYLTTVWSLGFRLDCDE